jgi:hypothetical protein
MASSPPASTNTKPAAPAKRGPPRALPVILAIVIPVLYSLFAGPLFASAYNPDASVPRLTVLVASYDTGLIGPVFSGFFSSLSASPSWVTNNGALPTTIPGLTFMSSVSTAEDLRNQVRQSSAWGAIFVNPGASSRLLAALSSPTAAQSYDPSGAVTIVWDEARNNVVSAPRVAGPAKGLTGALAVAVSRVLLAQFLTPGSTINSNAFNLSQPAEAAALARVLAAPVGYSEESLFPFTAPVLNQALAVGQILMCVFSLVITNLVLGPIKFHPLTTTAAPGLQLAFRRYVLILVFACMIGAAFATITIGLARSSNLTMLTSSNSPGVTYGATNAVGNFDGPIWARVWACQWLESSIFALYLCLFAVLAGGPEVAGALLGPMIIFNAISLNVDVSDPGYQFFWYAPFWHSSELIRNIMFGTLSSRVGMHIGVHFLWFILESALFFFVHVRVAPRDAAARAASAAPRPALVDEADKEATSIIATVVEVEKAVVAVVETALQESEGTELPGLPQAAPA